MPLDPFFHSPTQRREMLENESTAKQIGRDDFNSGIVTTRACPFPKESNDAVEWLEGWRDERDGN